jgi:hypothetical protein
MASDPGSTSQVLALADRRPHIFLWVFFRRFWKQIFSAAGVLITVGTFYAKFEAVLDQGKTMHQDVDTLKVQVTVMQQQLVAVKEAQQATAADLQGLFNAARITVTPVPPPPKKEAKRR